MNKLQRANHVPKIISRLHLAHYKKWHIINFTSVPVYSQPWGMNLVSYKMKKFWFVSSAYIGLYMVHGVLIRAACHGEENNLFEGPHFYWRIHVLRKVKFIASLFSSINTFNRLNVNFLKQKLVHLGSVPPTVVKFNPLFSEILRKVFLSRNMHLDQMIKNIVVLYFDILSWSRILLTS